MKYVAIYAENINQHMPFEALLNAVFIISAYELATRKV